MLAAAGQPRPAIVTVLARGARAELRSTATVVAVAVRREGASVEAKATPGRTRRWWRWLGRRWAVDVEVAARTTATVGAIRASGTRLKLGALSAIVAVAVGCEGTGVDARARAWWPWWWWRRLGRRWAIDVEIAAGATATVSTIRAWGTRLELGAFSTIVTFAIGREGAGVDACARARGSRRGWEVVPAYDGRPTRTVLGNHQRGDEEEVEGGMAHASRRHGRRRRSWSNVFTSQNFREPECNHVAIIFRATGTGPRSSAKGSRGARATRSRERKYIYLPAPSFRVQPSLDG